MTAADSNATVITGIMLRSDNMGRHVIVSVELPGKEWVDVITENVADVGGALSHIVNPSGIESSRRAKESANG